MAAVDHPASSLPHLQLLSDLTPPSLERTWLTAPHPRLPIVATCSSDKTVRVYSLTNFRLLSTISGGHKRSVRTAAWKPHVQGESVLATGSFDATAGIWRRWDSYGQTTGDEGWGLGQEITTKSESQQEQAQETDILRQQQAADNDSDGGADDEDEEWRFAVLLDGHDSEVKSVSWSPSGMLLATCSRDKSIWVWEDLDDGDNNFETVAVMQEHEGDVKCVAWHPVEECLASASYDDTIRIWREDLDDWGQVACLRGHEGTVWFVDWESVENAPVCSEETLLAQWKEDVKRELSGPRVVSCSDDCTVRVWRRQPKEQAAAGGTGMPSILRPTGLDETWEEETVLPKVHDLAVYAVAWSKRTGLLASVGADGRIVIYEERLVVVDDDASAGESQPMDTDPPAAAAKGAVRPEWAVLAVLPGAHGIYEINHVAWAKRADRGRDVSREEEVLVTTADDGSVKVWTVKR
ncbi:iron-sulfur cluster assembly protein CIA1 [Aspergillus neoniger CBS 115656]|uniref:Probable cytosolic iron-sulfur protein assembly protein 1 n=1 Tax=Aspergillus neoniger (strain CBS 115656) TaxID=1448310 RepID=A0A318YEB3_ASPNB|nr:putative cytosolic iron-sulfur protein assembly protein 1 [Aspergillus neoniger CBS 115656]PYH32721.1 putative cytosolic iron-sulfur protein assembly protein 1 [Aspergillus neoniger CBS 115656]